MFDCIVIGGGPAALAAAVYLARQKMRFAIFAGTLGGQVLLSSDVENYLGYHDLNGIELAKRFRDHIGEYKDSVEVHEEEKVTRVGKIQGGFSVTTDKGMYQAKTLLIATGSEPRKLNVPGEKEYLNRGVTYCATCDAPLFKDKVVAVIGGGNSAMDAAIFASKYASHVHLVSLNPELRGEEGLKNACTSSANITILYEAKTTAIRGNAMVESLEYQTKEGATKALELQGVFIEIGLTPSSGFIDIVQKNQWGEIVVDKKNATNVEGIWAAGDVTDVTEKQIVVAAGEGAKAALSIIKYLQSQTTSS